VDPTFAVIRFQVVPAGGAVAVIELEGRPADPAALLERPVLLLEGPVEEVELPAIVEPDGVADGVLRASFAGPLELAVDPATRFALAIGRGPLLDLPAPDGVGDAALEVRLARTVNALRGDLHEARVRLGESTGDERERLAAEVEDLAAARDRLVAERDAAVAARETAEQAAAAAAAEREQLDAELADARDDADDLRGELENAHARIAALEATNQMQRVPRTPRGTVPPRRHARSPRAPDEATEVREPPPPRHDHGSLGRGVARAVIVVLIALLAAALVVLVLGVQLV
jgi:hypothetical protein